jgi:hypothetical protein
MRYHIGLCQRYAKNIHGYNNDSSPQIIAHYLCLYSFDYYTREEFDFAIIITNKSQNEYVRNQTFEKKITRITIEIIETETMEPGNETIAIYKTFWLRIFQRKVRKWIALKKTVHRIVNKNKIDKMVMKREYYGNRFNIRSISLQEMMLCYDSNIY